MSTASVKSGRKRVSKIAFLDQINFLEGTPSQETTPKALSSQFPLEFSFFSLSGRSNSFVRRE